MKYYKIIHNKKVVDIVSGNLRYVKYQKKHRLLLLCDESEAQGILSDSDNCYHTYSLLPFPVDIFPSATLEEITKSEYEQLSRRCLKSVEEINEELILDLMERGVL